MPQNRSPYTTCIPYPLQDNAIPLHTSASVPFACIDTLRLSTSRLACVLSSPTERRSDWAQVFPRPDSDGHLEANPLPSPRGVMRAAARGRISENTPWVPPSIEVARRFHDAIHPRLPDGDKFNFLKAKTGRFCFLGGCGEQLDLWDEVGAHNRGRKLSPFCIGVGPTCLWAELNQHLRFLFRAFKEAFFVESSSQHVRRNDH